MALKSTFPDINIPDNVSFPQLVLRDCDKHKDKIAIVDGLSGRSYTYGALKDLTRKCGSALTKRGFKKGDVFAILLPNIPEYAIAFYGITSIGGIVTTINPLYTAEEIVHQLKDAAASYIVTIPLFLDKTKEASSSVGISNVFVIGESDACESFSELFNDDGSSFPEDVSINPKEDVICLPYSSGTTGLPKGVMLTHFNLVADVAMVSAESLLEFTDNAAVLGLLPFFHIYGMVIVMGVPFYQGGKVVCMTRFEQETFLQIIQDYKITHAPLVPPIILFLAKHPLVDKYDLSSVIEIVSGAAPLGVELSAAVVKRLPTLKTLRQGYGMTELSPCSHLNPKNNYKDGSGGMLVPNVEGKVVDIETGEPLGEGKDGEVCVRGPIVMKGYLNNAEATANTIDSDGWLHTGDIGHFDSDGHFFIVDRLKELIKYKGYQVPPAELEGLLISHPRIDDAAVIGIPDVEAGELPMAFVVSRGEITADEVAKFVEKHVAPYKKLKGGIKFVEKIPKSGSGKILRRELKKNELKERKAVKNSYD